MKDIKHISVIGLGLIGGSLALSLKNLNNNFNIIGYDASLDSMNIAKYRKIIDEVAQDIKSAVKEADLIIIATPVREIVKVAGQIKDSLKEGAIVTDVGSAKQRIVESMNHILPDSVVFIGGHPMAGSENEGILSATPDLFRNAFYVLTPTDKTITKPLMTLHSLFTRMGSKVVSISPKEHDRIVALISHMPHVLSSNLVDYIDDQQKTLKNLFKLCAGGFRDMTRIAASNPGMWVDITMENREEIINVIEGYIGYLESFKQSLSENDYEFVKNHYVKAKKARMNLPKYVEKDISKLYELRIAIPDKPGVLSDITLALSSNAINIEDISIFHSTEYSGGGILKVLVQGENAGNIAKKSITDKGYEVSVKKVIGE
ncbi:MAG: prephenate dehydrogenase/arogenate dehydrogenase family protein [Actinomycetota bacterium]